MSSLERLAMAVLERNHLEVRALRLELPTSFEAPPDLIGTPFIIAAAIACLLSERGGIAAPAWTMAAPKLPAPFYVSSFAETSPRLQKHIEQTCPDTLRRFGLFAFPDWLTYA